MGDHHQMWPGLGEIVWLDKEISTYIHSPYVKGKFGRWIVVICSDLPLDK